MGKDSERKSSTKDLRQLIFPSNSPQWVDELRKEDLKKLTEIFHLGKPNDKTEDKIRRLISDLPKGMRRERLSRKNNELCEVHQGLNAEFMYDLHHLVHREVCHHLLRYEAYPELQKPIDAVIIKRLQAMRGMWTKYDKREAEYETAWKFESSRCQGCMIGRVATDRDALRNLRIAILARTQTRKMHIPRRLISFVDGCIDRFPNDMVEMYDTSSHFAFIMKATRKACTKKLEAQHGRRRHRPKVRHHRDPRNYGDDEPRYHGDNEPTSHWSESDTNSGKGKQAAQGQAPRSIHEPHPADRYVIEPLRPRPKSRTDTDEGHSGGQTGSKSSLHPSDSPHLRKFVLNGQARASAGSSEVEKLTKLVADQIESFQDSYYPPAGASWKKSSVPSEAVDAVDEMTDMYRNMGMNPYRDYQSDDSDAEYESCEEKEGPNHPHAPENLAAAMDTWSMLCNKEKD